jgi:hypothetical protein
MFVVGLFHFCGDWKSWEYTDYVGQGHVGLKVRSPGLADLARCVRMFYHNDVDAFYCCSLLEK